MGGNGRLDPVIGLADREAIASRCKVPERCAGSGWLLAAPPFKGMHACRIEPTGLAA